MAKKADTKGAKAAPAKGAAPKKAESKAAAKPAKAAQPAKAEAPAPKVEVRKKGTPVREM